MYPYTKCLNCDLNCFVILFFVKYKVAKKTCKKEKIQFIAVTFNLYSFKILVCIVTLKIHSNICSHFIH